MSPLLHSRTRESIEFSDAPGQVLAKLQKFAGEQFHFEFDDSDSDNILFEMTGESKEIIIHGIIRRWHGTECRVDFVGEVNVAEHTRRFVRLIGIGIVVVVGIYLFDYIILGSHRVSPINAINDLLTLGVMWFFATTLVALLAFVTLTFIRDRINTATNKRWKRQQELVKIVENMRKI